MNFFSNIGEKRGWYLLGLIVLIPFFVIFSEQIMSFISLFHYIPFAKLMIVLDYVTEWFILLGILSVVVYFTEKKQLSKFLLSFVVALGFVFLLKYFFGVVRPESPFLTLSGFSFPSAHAASAFVAYVYLAKLFPKTKGLWLGLAILIAFSRVYLFVHYPVDILVGVVIGLSASWGIEKLGSKNIQNLYPNRLLLFLKGNDK